MKSVEGILIFMDQDLLVVRSSQQVMASGFYAGSVVWIVLEMLWYLGSEFKIGVLWLVEDSVMAVRFGCRGSHQTFTRSFGTSHGARRRTSQVIRPRDKRIMAQRQELLEAVGAGFGAVEAKGCKRKERHLFGHNYHPFAPLEIPTNSLYKYKAMGPEEMDTRQREKDKDKEKEMAPGKRTPKVDGVDNQQDLGDEDGAESSHARERAGLNTGAETVVEPSMRDVLATVHAMGTQVLALTRAFTPLVNSSVGQVTPVQTTARAAQRTVGTAARVAQTATQVIRPRDKRIMAQLDEAMVKLGQLGEAQWELSQCESAGGAGRTSSLSWGQLAISSTQLG
ncbi:hypothetical protein F2Q69_00005618 [Brassica cretica]|uniref:Uncharacterized protein n=1 Tax=Brassica cretica TaxID=69181 RepID=A0A8S9P279_BRACR|nr:hypothetical protein F2Q69_00005618 [Brassica cretica]